MSNDLTHNRHTVVRYLTGLLLLAACQHISASSFLLHEQSVSYLGNAYSGTASTAEDASTGYYNPAGLTLVKDKQAVISGIYYNGNLKLYNATATNNIGSTFTSMNSAKAKSNAVIPGVHLSAQLNKCWTVALNVVAPFGLNSRYASNSVARYMATKSTISTVDISPAVAFKINDMFSVGAGFDAMYITATLDSAINFGAGDGYVQNIGHTWTYGYHLGVLFQPTCNTRMGLTYFSLFNPTIRGHVYTLNYPVAPAPTTLRASLPLPDRVVYSITQNLSSAWTAVADVEWVHWSRLQHLFVQYNTGAGSFAALNNKNTWRVALGANYRWSECMMFKGGLAYDESPVRTPFRIAPVPDSDRYWIAVGVKFKMDKHAMIDIGYSHLFFKKSNIQEIVTAGGFTHNLFGNYKNSADLVGIQLTWNFV